MKFPLILIYLLVINSIEMLFNTFRNLTNKKMNVDIVRFQRINIRMKKRFNTTIENVSICPGVDDTELK